MTYRTPTPPPTQLTLSARSDTGPCRAVNEDSFFVADLATGACERRAPLDISLQGTAGFVLAAVDRSGGSGQGGEHFDAVVAHAILGALASAPLPSADAACRERLREAVAAAHRAAVELGKDGPLRHVGATLTVALVRGERLHFAHLGDTRAYVFRAGNLLQVTRDDSLENAMRDAGRLDDEAMATLADHSNVVTKALGVFEAQAAVGTVELCSADVLLLCSDGLHRMVDDAGLEGALNAHGSTSALADALVAAAVKAGGHDNVTVIVARVEAGEAGELGRAVRIES